MLTQEPAPVPKCKLNISSCLTLPNLSACLTCPRNSMSVILLLQIMGDDLFITGSGSGDRGWVLSCSFCFCFLFHLSTWPLPSPALYPFF